MQRVTARPAKPPRQAETSLPALFSSWFATRGWQPRAHQLALVAAAQARRSTLLIAPTGAGKTLAGFLPSLIDLTARPANEPRLHTLYISPLKALAVDVQRNLLTPVSEMGLPVRIETRTGDTPQGRRQRQRLIPPDILLTTPEQIALLISHSDAPRLFGALRAIVLDELHALVLSKRGDLLSLGLQRLLALAPGAIVNGLSATVARPSELQAYIVPQRPEDGVTKLADKVVLKGGAAPVIRIIGADKDIPWSGHSARHAYEEIYAEIGKHKLTLIFVNTRSQAEMIFQAMWRLNEQSHPIALHHGSLEVGQRRKVEAAMAAGALRAVVATSTLDLGIDWGDVDLVIHVGAPKGASRLAQRIGRSNHRLDEPSQALLVPANRFEVMECEAALEAAAAGAQDTPPVRPGGLDVLAQHVMGTACAGPFLPEMLFREVRGASPYNGLTRDQFDRVIDFVSTGGYALRAYDRYARLKPNMSGGLRLAHPNFAQQYRLNVGTIVEMPMLKVRLIGAKSKFRLFARQAGQPPAVMGGKYLGEIEESFIEMLAPGDTFIFAGQVIRFEAIREQEAYVTRAEGLDAKVPSYAGGKFPLSTYLAARVRDMLADSKAWKRLPVPVGDWLRIQKKRSAIPRADQVLVETFPRGNRFFMVTYPFEGRLAHQTLGMLLTRRLDRAGAKPLGFVASEYALAIWCLEDMSAMIAGGRLDIGALFEEDMLGDDLDAWLASSNLMRRTFRYCAVIAGLIERRHPGREKTGRQVTVSSDLIYNVLREYEPSHILLEAAWADAASGLLDIERLGLFLKRAHGHIVHRGLPRVSPLAVPVMLEIGRESVPGEAAESLLRESAEDLIAEAMR